MEQLDIRSVSYDADVTQMLVQEMADDLAQYYGPASYPAQDPSLWAAPDGAMFVVYMTGEPIACGGLLRRDASTAELKRMFVRPSYRRTGVARKLLTALETEAERLGYVRIVLETGVAQLAAQALYLAAGYKASPCWPPHDDDPTSVCFSRELTASEPP